jgi:hypothetical protein
VLDVLHDLHYAVHKRAALRRLFRRLVLCTNSVRPYICWYITSKSPTPRRTFPLAPPLVVPSPNVSLNPHLALF